MAAAPPRKSFKSVLDDHRRGEIKGVRTLCHSPPPEIGLLVDRAIERDEDEFSHYQPVDSASTAHPMSQDMEWAGFATITTAS